MCQGCRNTCDHKYKVIDARENVLQRKPEAFFPKRPYSKPLSNIQNRSGCRCRKTRCLKKYCVCYNSGKTCGEGCTCIGCENKGV
mmetsp:Transcript_16239/g.21339  ORF Transcript_16239/g.21339 Transcript_16239/m.21339 type:complete len:85 (-) Transcript_16239:304-558(-)